MNRNNERPSRALFGEAPRLLHSNLIADSGRSNFMMLQQNLRSRSSISRLELETTMGVIERAALTLTELTALKDIARTKAADNKRTVGWHCGFEDLMGELQEMLFLKDAA